MDSNILSSEENVNAITVEKSNNTLVKKNVRNDSVVSSTYSTEPQSNECTSSCSDNEFSSYKDSPVKLRWYFSIIISIFH